MIAQAVRIASYAPTGATVPSPDEAPDVAEMLAAAYATHQRGMRYAAYRILEDWEEAADVVQEAFMVAWRKADLLPSDPAHLRGYLYTIAKHRSYDRLKHWSYVRRALRGEVLPLDWPPDGADDPDGTPLSELVAAPDTAVDPERAAVRARVRRVLARMPRAAAEALLLDDGAGWKLGRVATFTAALDGRRIGASAMKMRVYRARSLFARLWRELDGAPA